MILAVALHAKLKTASLATAFAVLVSRQLARHFIPTAARLIGAWRRVETRRRRRAAAAILQHRECDEQLIGGCQLRFNTGLAEECLCSLLDATRLVRRNLKDVTLFFVLARWAANFDAAHNRWSATSRTLLQRAWVRLCNLKQEKFRN